MAEDVKLPKDVRGAKKGPRTIFEISRLTKCSAKQCEQQANIS